MTIVIGTITVSLVFGNLLITTTPQAAEASAEQIESLKLIFQVETIFLMAIPSILAILALWRRYRGDLR